MRSWTWRVALAVICSAALSSCASINVNSLPQPGDSRTDGYDIVIEFENVLNLPERAKVIQDGRVVGVVTNVTLEPERVDVTARIDANVGVPNDIHATLQQSTVLGDTYVALERRTSSQVGSLLVSAGGRIPLSQSTSPQQLEDTIVNLANFVGSGSIQRIQNTIIGVNKVTPERSEELRAMVSRVTVDLADLSNNIKVVDTWLNGLADTTAVMNQNLSMYQYWFSPAGMLGFDRATQVAAYVGTVLPSVGSIYSGGFWLVPLLDSLTNAAGALQQSKWNVEAEVPAWRTLFTEDFMPVDKNPAINITSIKTPEGRELIGNAQEVLRILGATP